MAYSFTDADVRGLVHAHPFDPTCGYTRADLAKVTPPEHEPADFDAFWQATYAAAMAANDQLAPTWRELPSPTPEVQMWEGAYTSWDGLRIGGWLAAPVGGPTRGLIVQGHGYGTPTGVDPGWAKGGYAVWQMCHRGFGISRQASIPPDNSAHHVIHGVDDPETYVLRGCAVEQWHAATLLLQRYPGLADRLYYYGGSFGGGMGALQLAWDPRFRAAFLSVPTFGHQPIRLRFPCCGSGESVRQRYRRTPEILRRTLRYFDAATAARRIRIPVLCEVAAFDPAVIPPGQHAVGNALQHPASRLQHIPCAHFDAPLTLFPQAARDAFGAAAGAFFASHAPA